VRPVPGTDVDRLRAAPAGGRSGPHGSPAGAPRSLLAGE